MTCKLCIEAFGNKPQGSGLKGSNTFLTGSLNFKKSAVTDHEISSGHVDALAKAKAKDSAPCEKQTSQAGRALLAMRSSERQKLNQLFRNAHAVGKQGRPISDYTWLCNVTEANGTEIGQTYRNSKAAVVFLSYISGAEKDKTVEMIRSAQHYSLLIDGSTDLSGDEQESVFVRTSHNGKVSERFLAMGSPESTTAEHLKEFVDTIVSDYGLEKGL